MDERLPGGKEGTPKNQSLGILDYFQAAIRRFAAKEFRLIKNRKLIHLSDANVALYASSDLLSVFAFSKILSV